MEIKTLVEEHGLTLADAVHVKLRMEKSSLAEWARERGFHRSSVSELINGSGRAYWWEIREALAEWSGTDVEWIGKHLTSVSPSPE